MRMVLYADEGRLYTNGEIFGKVIILAYGVDPSAFYQIDENAVKNEEADLWER